jgi:MoxR-like ATPase
MIPDQSRIIDLLDDLRTSNRYVHNDLIPGVTFKSDEFASRPVYAVETFAVVNALVTNGTMLLYGGHGGGKTTLCKILGQIFTGRSANEIEAGILRGHPQLTEEKILGTLNLKQMMDPRSMPENGAIDVQWNEFVISPWKIVDEINRLSHYAQNILLSLLAEGVVKYQNQSRSVNGFTVFATMNPKDDGNVVLPMPFMDRFAFALPITMPDYASMQTIGKKSYRQNRSFPSLCNKEEALHALQDKISDTVLYQPEAETFIDVILSDYRLCERTAKEASEHWNVDNGLCGTGDNECRYRPHVCSKIVTPLSVRVKEDLYRYGKALAWFLGEREVTKAHIKALAPYMIWHRSRLSKKFLNDTVDKRFKNNEYYVNPELEGTREIIDTIYDRFEKKYPQFLSPMKKACSAQLSESRLDQLIETCKNMAGDDLLVDKELLPDLEAMKSQLKTIESYQQAIDQAETHQDMTNLQKCIKREYHLKNRQMLTKLIEQKQAKLKIDRYTPHEYIIEASHLLLDGESVDDCLSDLRKRLAAEYGSEFRFSPYFAQNARLTSFDDPFDLDVTPRRANPKQIKLKFKYQGPENTEILELLKQYADR